MEKILTEFMEYVDKEWKKTSEILGATYKEMQEQEFEKVDTGLGEVFLLKPKKKVSIHSTNPK